MPNLNSQQQALVDFVVSGEGSCNMIARAGTGKTYTLVNGVIVAITANKLGSVVLMAFNKSAATEFEQRISRLADELDMPSLHNVDTGTVHSLGLRFWRRHLGNARIQVQGYKVANIIQNRYGRSYEFLAQTTKLVSFAKQGALTPDELRATGDEIIAHYDIDANGSSAEIINVAAWALEESNRERFIIDFDDMIYLPVINQIRVDKFDFVLIDEAQDTNPVRRELAFMMMKDDARLIAVGDDKQAIYGFTGANADSLEQIKTALNSIELPLTITYRCPKAVVEEANRLVPDLIAHESAPIGKVRTINAFVEVETNDNDN